MKSWAYMSAVVQGLDAAAVKLRRDTVNNALYIELVPDGEISIRIGLGDPERFESDRAGLEELAAAALAVARQITELQAGAGAEAP